MHCLLDIELRMNQLTGARDVVLTSRCFAEPAAARRMSVEHAGTRRIGSVTVRRQHALIVLAHGAVLLVVGFS